MLQQSHKSVLTSPLIHHVCNSDILITSYITLHFRFTPVQLLFKKIQAVYKYFYTLYFSIF